MDNYNLTQNGAEVQRILDSVQTIDSIPVEDSAHPISSGAVYDIKDALGSETYDRVDDLTALGTASADKAGIIWLVGLENAASFDRYVVGKNGSSYVWVPLGSTTVNLAAKADKVGSGHNNQVAGFNSNGNLKDSGIAIDNVAQQNGYYKEMRTGLADNLADEKAFSEMGMLHMTAASVEVTGSPKAITYPSKDIADGMSQVLTLEGNGCAFNQLYPAGSDGLFATDSDCPTTLPVRYSNEAGTTELGYLDCAEVLLVSDLTASDCALLSAILTADAARSCATVWLDEAGNKLAVSVSEGAAAWTIEATGAAATPTQVCRRSIRVKASEVNCGASGADWWFTATKGSLRQIKDMAVKEGIDGDQWTGYYLAKPFDTCSVMDWIHYCEAKEGAQGIETQNAGTLAGAKLYQIKAVTSANLLDPATGQAELPWYQNEGDAVDGQFTLVKPAGSAVTLSLLNKATGLVSTPTVDAEGHFTIGSNSVLTVTAASLDGIGVLATYDGSMDEEELDEYAAQTLVIDVTKIFGKLNGEGEYVQVAAEGLRKTLFGNIVDKIDIVNAKANIPIAKVNMGNLTWSQAYWGDTQYMASLPNGKNVGSSGGAFRKQGLFAAKYVPDPNISSMGGQGNLTIKRFDAMAVAVNNLYDKDPSAFKSAVNNQDLFYELATPLHYENLIYREPGQADIPLNQLTRSLQVCNWATTKAVCAAPTETTVEGHTSVLPQSAAPVITSEYSSDICETVDSHTQEIAALDTKVAALWAAVFPTT